MSTIAVNRMDDTLSRFLWASLILHGVLAVVAGVSTYMSHSGENWGGPGGSVTVGIVGSVPAIPLPRPDVESPSRVVDESKGLFKSEPKATPQPEPDATPIPKFEKNKPPKYITRPSKVLENPTPPPTNAVPYGGGGTPTIPVTSFAMGAGLISDQLHRSHDAAPLIVKLLVVGIDQGQQLAQLQHPRAGLLRLHQLLAQARVQLLLRHPATLGGCRLQDWYGV